MAIVTGDRYLEKLVKFVEDQAGALIDGSLVLKLNPVGLHYVHSRLEALHQLEKLLAGAPIDYLRAYVSDLGDYRALEQLRRILRLLTSLKVVSVLPPPTRDPTPLSLLSFGRLRVLELRGCDLSTSAARGLLELRHTLEKIICHNSTDALRHVFASRISDVRYCPSWNRLSFVSCACNRLVLMDESLQLLPAVETLDLSRNKFAKVDNLRKCTKLKYLDLGFNNLRTIAPFNEVSCNIIKLVLRNNALATLRGLENLKSLEGLDVSYNIISKFSELEFLAGLPYLRNLWLEGNPLCCSGWYRAQVFSYFDHADKLILDEKGISTTDLWKQKIIHTSRQKRPSSFGFYSPAKDDVEGDVAGDGSVCKKRRKASRLALIESEEESVCFSSDQESPSGDNEIQSREENAVSDDEAEIVDLINRVELMKKERSISWLREFKEWMDHESENFAEGSSCGGLTSQHVHEGNLNNSKGIKHHGETSRHVFDSLQTSGDETSTNVFESDSSFVDTYTGSNGRIVFPDIGKMNPGYKYLKSGSIEQFNHAPLQHKSSDSYVHRVIENGSLSPLTTIDDPTESLSSSAYPGSPPHYQQDILSRRHNLIEEILHLSAESYSMASSDSDTSSNEDEQGEPEYIGYEPVQSQNEEHLDRNAGMQTSLNLFKGNYGPGNIIHRMKENYKFLFNSHAEQISSSPKNFNSNSNEAPAVSDEGEIDHSVDQEADQLEKRQRKRRSRKRVISLTEHTDEKKGTSEKINGNNDTFEALSRHGKLTQIGGGSDSDAVTDKKQSWKEADTTPAIANIGRLSDDFIEGYFNSDIADSSVNEICRHCMRCDCILEPGSLYREREVALVLSSENKLYVILIGITFDGSGSILSLLASHRVEAVQEISVGIGLQFVRVYIDKGATYLFLTRSVEKSRQLLTTIQLFGPCSPNEKCSLKSLEQVQVELFEKQICGGSKLSIFQYAMLLFWNDKNEEESWVLRSLFVCGGYVFVCIEDLKQFNSLSNEASSAPYFSLDSCCSVGDISELIIEAQDKECVTIVLKQSMTKFCLSSRTHTSIDKGKKTSCSPRWKLKWFSKESLINFVSLLKAIHAWVTTCPLSVAYVS